LTADQAPAPGITDPAAAAAAAQCYLARTWVSGGGIGQAIASRHPRACDWCPYPTTELIRLVDEYNRRSFDGEGRPTDPVLRSFMSRPRRDQRVAVHIAQYGEDPLVDGTQQTRAPL
jgi:hypothetical protein